MAQKKVEQAQGTVHVAIHTLYVYSSVSVVRTKKLLANQSVNQSISTNHLHKNDQWLTNKVKNNKTKIKPNE